MKCTICWNRISATHIPPGITEKQFKDNIRKYFNISPYTSVNGEAEADVPNDKLDKFREGAYKGFYKIRNKR